MSYGPCDFQDTLIEAARAAKVKGIPRDGDWSSDQHDAAALAIARHIEEGAQAKRDCKTLLKALRHLYDEHWVLAENSGHEHATAVEKRARRVLDRLEVRHG